MAASFPLRTLLTAACLALTGAPATASDDLEIPFDFVRSGHMTTQILIDENVQTTAVIDSGANFPMIGARAAAQAGISTPNGDPTVSVLGMGGLEDRPLIRVDRLEVANLRFENVEAALQTNANLPGPATVLPLNAFEGRTVDFDFQERRVSLYDTAPRRPRDQRSILDLRNIHDIYFAKVRVNRKTGWAMLDTGSSITYVNSAYADAAGGLRRDTDIHLEGVTGSEASVRTLNIDRLALGRHGVEDFRVLVADPPIFEHLGLDEEPAMVLGLDALRGFRVQIDRRREKLILSVPDGRQGRTIYSRN